VSVNSLDTLKELYAWMREHGVQYAKVGDVEMSLGPMPAPAVSEEPESAPLPEDSKGLRRQEAFNYFNGMFGRPPSEEELDMYEGAVW
jgi:hypothetical protein